MEEQFIPPVRMRLDANETLQYAEQSVKPYGGDVGINCSTGLAALNAYLGESERALYWCSQVEVKAASMGRELADWEIRKRQFTSELREVVNAGKARDFLESGS